MREQRAEVWNALAKSRKLSDDQEKQLHDAAKAFQPQFKAPA